MSSLPHHLCQLHQLQVQKEGLTNLYDVCAIVHPTNKRLDLSGGVSKAISAAAGPLFEQCCLELLTHRLERVPRGVAEITTFPSAHTKRLHCRHVIHAVLPVCSGEF